MYSQYNFLPRMVSCLPRVLERLDQVQRLLYHSHVLELEQCHHVWRAPGLNNVGPCFRLERSQLVKKKCWQKIMAEVLS